MDFDIVLIVNNSGKTNTYTLPIDRKSSLFQNSTFSAHRWLNTILFTVFPNYLLSIFPWKISPLFFKIWSKLVIQILKPSNSFPIWRCQKISFPGYYLGNTVGGFLVAVLIFVIDKLLIVIYTSHYYFTRLNPTKKGPF